MSPVPFELRRQKPPNAIAFFFFNKNGADSYLDLGMRRTRSAHPQTPGKESMTDPVSPGGRGTQVPTGEPKSFLHVLDGEGKAVGLGNANPIPWLDLLHCLNSPPGEIEKTPPSGPVGRVAFRRGAPLLAGFAQLPRVTFPFLSESCPIRS